MSYSYSGDPATSDRDAVRYEVGDTNEKIHLVQDEEINYALIKEGTILKAAARIAEGLAARYARESTTRSSVYTSFQGDVQKHYEELSKKLRARSIRSGNFRFPAMSKDAKEKNRLESDLNRTTIYRGIHCSPDVPNRER
jgi:hypothetical protein